jgi:5'-nucleotidase
MKPLRILVSNDDGIFAPGISALAESLRGLGEVIVVAPDRQQSAVGHAITMHSPVRVYPFHVNGTMFGYAIDGTPADAVKFAVRNVMQDNPPDILVSGINHGSNTAVNVIYSGTVSAATEGAILGIPSIAISLTTYDTPDFRYAASFAKRITRLVAEKGLPAGTLLNVNVPNVPEKEIRGIVVTRQGRSNWDDYYEKRFDPGKREYYWLTGSLQILDTEEDTDQVAINNNMVSVTPIHYDLTNYNVLNQLKTWNLDLLTNMKE